jgi:uncharacterized protein (TIGR00255 family)
LSVTCDIKTINHRFLDVSIRSHELPNDIDVFIRELTSKKIKRGSIDIRFKIVQPKNTSYEFNMKSLDNLLAIIDDNNSFNSKDLTFGDIKDVPGIINTHNHSQISSTILKNVFKAALSKLIATKNDEGMKIQKIFDSKIKKINKNNQLISKGSKAIIKRRNERLRSKINDHISNINEERLEQEISLLLLKHDVAEEQERISFHLNALNKELNLKNSRGKKIDFILQELFRETSTLSVKIDDPAHKSRALDMKLLVEEMREQAQNVE